MDIDKVLEKQKELSSKVDFSQYKTEINDKWLEPKKISYDEKKRLEISYAQSWNLSVAMCARWFDSTKNPTSDQKEMLENWQKYFLEKLTR